MRRCVADVAQLVERRFVVPVVAGSIPVIRPSNLLQNKINELALRVSLRF